MQILEIIFLFSAASGDLLGLSTPPSQTGQGNTGVLLDVLGDIYGGPKSATTNNANSALYNPKKYVARIDSTMQLIDRSCRFVCKNNGVLFENELIQIGVKSEFRQNLGRLALFYGNKTSAPLTNFVPTISYLEDQAAKLSIQMKGVEPVLEAGAQIQQQLNAECIDDYTGARKLVLAERSVNVCFF